jgi:hypothetical protein
MDILKIVSKITGITSAELKEKITNEDGSFNDIAESYVSDLLSDKLKSKPDKTILESYEKKGFKEAMKIASNAIVKNFKVEIKEDEKIEEIIAKIRVEDLTPELEKIKKEKEEIETNFNTFKKQINQKENISKIKSIAESKLINYKLPDEIEKKQKRIDAFVKTLFLDVEDYQEEKGKIYLIKGSERILDENSAPITAEKRIEEQLDMYFDKKEKGKPAGTRKQDDEGDGIPRSRKEYDEVVSGLRGKELYEYNQKVKPYLADLK